MRIYGPSLSVYCGFPVPFQRQRVGGIKRESNWHYSSRGRRNMYIRCEFKTSFSLCRSVCDNKYYNISIVALATFLAAAAVIALVATADATETDSSTLSNIPQTLSGECTSAKDCKKPRIQKPKSRKAESCTIKCVTTCIRGGDGSPGEGPLNVRRPLVVFKQGFRTRQYCLVECSDICNLISDAEDGR